MTKSKSPYHGHRFPAVVISQAVRWYYRFQLSLRDIEELMFERGVVLSYETIRRWCDKFGASFAHRAKAVRRKPGSTWHLDEMFVTLRGEPYVLWRAVDQHGAELDVLVQKRRDKGAAKRFFKRVLAACPEVPCKIVTDQLRSYPAAKADIPALAKVRHVFVKACARVNNRAENSHQPTRERERRMRGFRRLARAQAFLSSFGPIRQHFAIKRHLLRASLYRKQLAARFDAWRSFTGLAQDPSTAF
ncbi:IS6 family transposase [Verminephrobacter eiseniae]|uniref:IS6 family transposase n=1 Tax=Verminephrobacter eiseniae TaxID=364317 RepID=UPI0022383805|nr:IS6 family transposase [Verminephrobacter eiseniae]MCW5232326.1 IS6 family transposase [Verminephrobacter eiseniae]MCW5296110.1 IS6 family transposase [Verminephrobacter eiseniae]MCW8186940.1 IS6 family transposase [Verminephrobacter eiseniae]MCW8225326.1 IS6 family transposase [Verminephrobacter eiseniae]MCW8236346.1 IS6 family transposase [Verminephrobacter eiseniae]